jgi:hypothetical protein
MIDLPDVPAKWAHPPKELLSKLDRGKGVKLDYMGHADTTLALIAVDPEFSYDYARDDRGRMDVYESGSLWVVEGTLTVHGVTRPCVGTCEKRKVEIHKELLGDLLRNGAMRFGIATGLWSKLDDVTDAHFAKPAEPKPLSDANLDKFVSVCEDSDIHPDDVMARAFPDGTPDPLLDSHLPAMRDAFKKMKAAKEAAAAQEPITEVDPEAVDELLASDAQVKKIQVLMGEAGIKDRTERLGYIQRTLGLDARPASTKNLSTSQAHALIEAMEADLARADLFDGEVES